MVIQRPLCMKWSAAVSIARRGGATATMDVLNKYFLKTNMPVVPSQYWSIAHGTVPGEVVRDEVIRELKEMGFNTERTIGVYPGSSWTIVDSEDVLGVNLNIKPKR